ncbi:protein translocase subunit SecD [Arsenicicoccus piscis]|uniref:Protein translocase subunit SecD n=1 Tax=Arsenicicoccus piscis TaxID=673954 RepID=A0ABQ6HP18_9MICO|nr:hypothetical protein GCM10025862_18540 [Arsenicicoccus piscis]
MDPKLGLDLAGGTQVVLEPQLAGGQTVNEGQMTKAVDIMRKRVDGSGIAEAEVSTQGGNNIVVSVPSGTPQAVLDSLEKSSMMRFRPVLVTAPGAPTATPSAGGAASPTATGSAATPASTPAAATPSAAGANFPAAALRSPAATTPGATATPTPAATPAATSAAPTAPAVTPGAAVTSAPAATAATGAATPSAKPTDPSDLAWVTDALAKQFTDLDCSKQPDSVAVDDASKPLVACDDTGAAKFILGPTEIEGSHITDAQAGLATTQSGATTGQYVVNITFDREGGQQFYDVTKRLNSLPSPRNQLAMVLDGKVISAPSVTQGAIAGGRAEISGTFNSVTADALAQQLKFGALPLSFTVQTKDTISPQLGSDQLRLGLLAGAIGLVLVVLYSLIQYRVLGLVTVASLIMAAAVIYLSITLLGWSQNFRLSMAGVTGLILSIGTTADSFIVYFERVRDEIRDGRSTAAAVEAGWKRARGTILISDAVNLLAAVVLYLLASSNVRGFAFTLGLTTVIDVIIVMLFTHPLLSILARTKFFGEGRPWSGLEPERLGVDRNAIRYRGRGRFSAPTASSSTSARGTRGTRGGSQVEPDDEPVGSATSDTPAIPADADAPVNPDAQATPDAPAAAGTRRRRPIHPSASGRDPQEGAVL